MTDNVIVTTQAGTLTTIVINRPQRRNAVGVDGWSQIKATVEAASKNDSCRVILLRGAAGHFGAGADIAEFGSVFSTPQKTLAYFERMESTMRAIEISPKPIIAAIEGLCIGACVALALACDIRVARADAVFAITPAKLGIAYPYGDIARVVRAIGPGLTKSMVFSGRKISGSEAMSYRLVDHAAAPGDFEDLLSNIVQEVSDASPFTINAAKEAVRSLGENMTPHAAGYPQRLLSAVTGEDFAEGLRAFHEKCPAKF